MKSHPKDQTFLVSQPDSDRYLYSVGGKPLMLSQKRWAKNVLMQDEGLSGRQWKKKRKALRRASKK